MKRINTYLVTKARRQRLNRTRQIRRGMENKAGWGLAALLACVFSLAIIWVGWQFSQLTTNLPSIEQIPAQLNAQSATFTQPTRLIDRTGTRVIKDLSLPGIQRKYMRMEGLGTTISKDFVDSVVALVEPGYWSSPGINLTNFNPDEHPTIAQQLVYHMLLSYEPATLQRTLREKLLAAQILSTYGHDQVLEWYINSLDFGHLVYGVEAGAQLYFGKSAEILNLPEAAMLAGVAVAPALNPWDSPAGARALQIEALKALALQGKITKEILKVALETNTTATTKQDLIINGSNTFSDQVVSQLETIIGRERVERGGLTIQTTMDAALQQNLECAIQVQLESLEGDQQAVLNASGDCHAARLLPLLPPGDATTPGSIAASAIVTDPTTGQVLALTGEITTRESTAIINTHPAGTIVSPFVYLNGFSQGLSPASLVWDAPSTTGQADSEMVNLDGTFHGPVRIRIAMANDYLQPLGSVLGQTGFYSLTRLTSSMGLNIPSGTSTQNLLDAPVSILELARAYNILAAEGTRYGKITNGNNLPDPYYVLKVWDENDTLIYDAGEPDRFAVVSSQLSYLLNSSLSDDLARRPTLGSPSMLQLGQASAAKIGQRKEADHIWTAGYTPQRNVIVWMGQSDQNTEQVQMNPRWSAGIWRAILEIAAEGLTNPGFRQPAGVGKTIVCDPSGLLPTEDCPSTVEEVFISGNEPTSGDTLYRKLSVNAETGRLATVFTPLNMVVEKVYLDIPAAYQSWARQAGLELAPTNYDMLQTASVDPAVHITTPGMFSYLSGKVEITGSASANAFSSYQVQIGQGLNPRDWQQIAGGTGQSIVEGKLADWDTTGLNGLYVIRLQVVDQENVVKNALLQVSVDNSPPEVVLQFPEEGTIIDHQSTPEVFVKADLKDASDVEHVEILIDGKSVSSLKNSPYYYNWKVQTGNHTLQVKAWDHAGNQSLSQEVLVTVN